MWRSLLSSSVLELLWFRGFDTGEVAALLCREVRQLVRGCSDVSPVLAQFFELLLSIPGLGHFLKLLLVKSFVEDANFDFVVSIFNRFLHCGDRLRLRSGKRIGKSSNVFFDQVLDTFGDLNFLSVVNHRDLALDVLKGVD